MSGLLKKLYHNENFHCLVLNVPEGWSELLPLGADVTIRSGLYQWIILFVYSHDQLNIHWKTLLNTLEEDGLLWIAYPKRSGKISGDISRDTLASVIQDLNWRPVAQVSMDENWSAMRFRQEKYVVSKAKNEFKFDSLPDELTAMLKQYPKCDEFFQQLSKTNKKEYAEWISNAKKTETRNKRLESTLKRLKANIPNPYVKFVE